MQREGEGAMVIYGEVWGFGVNRWRGWEGIEIAALCSIFGWD